MIAQTRNSVALALAMVALAVPAAAQGRGNAFGRGKTTAAAPTPSAAAAAPSVGIRQFGSWLDDASVMAPGTAWTAISFGYFRSSGSRQTDFPSVDAGLGVTRRVQVGFSVPYNRLHFPDGTGINGVGDTYVNAKVTLSEPDAASRLGVAITPVVEIASDPLPGASRLAWAAPLSFEVRGGSNRVFGTTGYFSRGAFFGSTAFERQVDDRVVVTASLTHMRSLKEDAEADRLGLPRNRTDVTGVASYFVTDSLAVFAGTGRTLVDSANGTSFLLTGGLSFSFTPRTAF
jgi:hypothetical protein